MTGTIGVVDRGWRPAFGFEDHEAERVSGAPAGAVHDAVGEDA